MVERLTDSASVPKLGRSLALAYEFNPLVRWMFADDLSGARLEGLFTSLVEFGLLHGQVFGCANADGAAIWLPPIGNDHDSSDQSAPDVTADTAEWSSSRRGAALTALASSRPTDPHFYLDAVGVVPTRRRRGIASALLAPVLADCDEGAIGAYLENSEPANTNFYARQGFEEIAPILMPEGAPLMTSMWRRPR